MGSQGQITADIVFLSTPSARRATRMALGTAIAAGAFLSTPSARRATLASRIHSMHQRHFYPRPPRGGRLARRTERISKQNISIHALREEGDPVDRQQDHLCTISIHALREEGDASKRPFMGWLINFYPRPPRGGRRRSSSWPSQNPIFLSTPSARRATVESVASAPHSFHFYPRPPRGGRRFIFGVLPSDKLFLSTPSARRATIVSVVFRLNSKNFYPRPPRGGRPCPPRPFQVRWFHFYPRPPRGGRLASMVRRLLRPYFYPRPPRGGRLLFLLPKPYPLGISIHALREEGDLST